MFEVNSISRGGNVGCTSPPVLVDLSGVDMVSEMNHNLI
jgi:hypothetical protein